MDPGREHEEWICCHKDCNVVNRLNLVDEGRNVGFHLDHEEDEVHGADHVAVDLHILDPGHHREDQDHPEAAHQEQHTVPQRLLIRLIDREELVMLSLTNLFGVGSFLLLQLL